MQHNLGIALLLTAGAGLSTTIGSLLGLAVRRPGPRFMGFTLGFSAGVMVLVSFVELLQGSIESVGFLAAHLGFFLGMASFFLVISFMSERTCGRWTGSISANAFLNPDSAWLGDCGYSRYYGRNLPR